MLPKEWFDPKRASRNICHVDCPYHWIITELLLIVIVRFAEKGENKGDILSRDNAEVNNHFPFFPALKIIFWHSCVSLWWSSYYHLNIWCHQMIITIILITSPVDLQRVCIEKAAAVLVLCNKFSNNPSECKRMIPPDTPNTLCHPRPRSPLTPRRTSLAVRLVSRCTK